VPIYEYLCEACSYRFEVKQSIKDDPIATCERCGKPVKRLISSPAIMFKGSGWYVTDYSDKLKPPSGSEPAATTAGDKAGDKKEAPSGAPATTSPAPAVSSTTTTPAGTTASSPPPPSTTTPSK